MFIPLHDANALKHIRLQWVTLGLIIANALVFLGVNISLPPETASALMISLGYVPAVIYDHLDIPPDILLVPEQFSYVTYAFFHADWIHLGSNMLFLWVFGDNVEDALGHVKFLIFYLLCAAAGAWAHGLMDTQSNAPLIGASGAVAGIVAAYLMLHPHVKVWILALARVPLRLPAWIPLLFWVGLQVFMILTDIGGEVSWAAHVGGLIAGALLVVVLKRRHVPLFDRAIVTPDAVELEAPRDGEAADHAPRPWGRG